MDIGCPHSKFHEAGCIEQNQPLHFEKTQIILNEFAGAYNPSIVTRKGGGYTLFFRHDVPCNHHFKNTRLVYLTYLGYVDLNDKLEFVSKPKLLPMLSPYCEDPRVVLFQGYYVLFFNEIFKEDPSERKMKIAIIDPDTKKILKIQTFPNQTRKTEKNWTPFVVKENDKERLFYIYEFSDLSVYEVILDDLNLTTKNISKKNLDNPQIIKWIQKYGPLRGGAPLVEIDGKLWSFFHSYFHETVFERGKYRKKYYYHMGLLTLDREASRVEKILPFPLIYDGAYRTFRHRTLDKWVVYPSGALYNPIDQKILLAVGENDGAIFLLKIDKNQLEAKMDLLVVQD